jgi:predicted DNA-binding transcriptional regulator YafY
MRLEKSEHLLHLAMLMQASAEGVSLNDIQEEFGVGRRTAERMRDTLYRLFPQVEELRCDDKTKRWRIPSGALSGLLQLTAEDLAEMKTAIDILERENLPSHAENLNRLWLKLRTRIRPEAANRVETDLEALLEAEGHAMRPGPKPKIDSRILYTLREAIKGFCKVRIVYNSRFKGDTTERVIAPYGFIYGSRHYLIAWCDHSQGMRTFSLPNIVDITLLDESYQKNPDFDLKSHTRRSFGVFQEEPYKVVWRFSPMVSSAVHEYQFHPSQTIEDQDDGSVIVTFTAGGWKEMCWYLMTWEGEVEVLEPAYLRDAYKEIVQKLYKGISSSYSE